MNAWKALRITSVVLMILAYGMTSNTITAQETGESLTVELQEFEGSGITGTAVLTESASGGTHVSMELQGQELDGNHPTHIHTGTCDNFDPNPLYPLQTINLSPVNNEGVSESDVEDASLESLQSGDYVILVHQSPEDLTTYLVCGEIGSGTPGVASAPETVATPETESAHHVPDVGVGTTAGSSNSLTSPMFLSLLALAFVSALGAGAFRMYRR
jgi:hypothetical protein